MEFIGSDEKALQKMNCMDFNNLPGVIREEIITCGGFEDPDSIIWRWQYGRTTIEGRGKSYFEAALEGLINCWMIFAERRKINDRKTF